MELHARVFFFVVVAHTQDGLACNKSVFSFTHLKQPQQLQQFKFRKANTVSN